MDFPKKRTARTTSMKAIPCLCAVYYEETESPADPSKSIFILLLLIFYKTFTLFCVSMD